MRILPPAAALLAAILVPAAASAQNRICQSINGQTQCYEGEGSVVCRSVNNRMECRQGPPQAMPPLTLNHPMPDIDITTGPDVSVTIENGQVRVRAGGVDTDDD